MNEKNVDVAREEGEVKKLVNSVFGEQKIPHTTINCIQGPGKISQLISHIHRFKVPSCSVSNLPKAILENYYDCRVILKIKREMLMDAVKKEKVEESSMLVRTKTVRVS